MKKNGFTLAEVLITLGIIGIVAAMTLPSLIQKQNEKVAITQLKKAYSVFSQAYLMAVANEGPADSWDIGVNDSAAGALKLYNIFKPYLLKVQDCGGNSGCFYNGNYKALFAPSLYRRWQLGGQVDFSKGKLPDGISFAFWSAGSGCNYNTSVSNSGSLSRICGEIWVDVNGDKNPNQAGVDLFMFQISKDGILPAGMKDHNSSVHFCKYKDASSTNGVACTAWAIAKGNMDYLRRDISWDE